MRELLKRSLRFMQAVGCSNDDICQLCDEIETELSRPVEPVYFAYKWDDGGFIGLSEDRELDLADRKDVIEIPLFTHPPAKPVLLSDDAVWDAYTKSTLQVMNSEQDDIYSFAQELEQAVLKANGIGGLE